MIPDTHVNCRGGGGGHEILLHSSIFFSTKSTEIFGTSVEACSMGEGGGGGGGREGGRRRERYNYCCVEAWHQPLAAVRCGFQRQPVPLG